MQFAEQRLAPYSMIGDGEHRYKVDNNISGTHNICSAIVKCYRYIYLVHLGTMGVYGYSKGFGRIPTGYLDITVNETGERTEILYPMNPGFVYHISKCLDQLMFQFYNKNWGLQITDLHQGIQWGINFEIKLHPDLENRFDYDAIYGTVLNRFIWQASTNLPLTIYETGGQKRAFINITDTAECIYLAIKKTHSEGNKVRIFNQVAEVFSVREFAEILYSYYGAEVKQYPKPRNELSENELELENVGFMELSFSPTKLARGLIDDVHTIDEALELQMDKKNILNSPRWSD